MSKQTVETSFEYDVAFSFLAEDEGTATALADLLGERFRCFIYSRRQEQLAGTDGEATFNRVFGQAARVVAVLYRDGWGRTPWTRIEETAIRNRAFEQGYDFALFVKLDAQATMPPWLPKTYIWLGYERWGLEGAASVVEARIEAAGGIPHPESAIEIASRLARRQDRELARQQFLHSEGGVRAAAESFREVVAATQKICSDMTSINAKMSFRLEDDPNALVVYKDGFSLTFGWQLAWGNVLDGSTLYVRVWRGPIGLRGYTSSKASEIAEWEFDFELNANGEFRWQQRSDNKRMFTPDQLADWAMSQFMPYVFGP